MSDEGKWVSRSFSLHSVNDKDLVDYLDEAARKKQLSYVVREALRFFIKHDRPAQELNLPAVLERLDRIEHKLDQGVAPIMPDEEVEDPELAGELDDLVE